MRAENHVFLFFSERFFASNDVDDTVKGLAGFSVDPAHPRTESDFERSAGRYRRSVRARCRRRWSPHERENTNTPCQSNGTCSVIPASGSGPG
ncbi:hypothetical protein PUN28_019500 [Cardiocondyla obscurior]|uniref:Uncharacterized protein n=1 Tax=Cardiocondyla obscurior TaxID=286306 RepID=A0AAW2EAQ6_9HYME